MTQDRILVFATGNAGKLREIREILKEPGLQVITMKEAGITEEIEENGTSFAQNALIKASYVAEKTGRIALADDSGLVIDALGGAPGILSARYLGRDTSYEVKNRKILELLNDVEEEKRTARFVCAAACVMPDGRSFVEEAAMEGRIAHEIAGENGFGYDPIFYLPEYGCTSAQISPEEKNRISHRGKALRALAEKLKKVVDI